MALTSARALHAPPLSFPSSPSLCSRPSSLALSISHAPSLSAGAQSPKSTTRVVVGLRRHVVARAAVSDIGPSIGEILGDVSIFTAAGEPVLFKDLWDQNEVKILISSAYLSIFLLIFVKILIISIDRLNECDRLI